MTSTSPHPANRDHATQTRDGLNRPTSRESRPSIPRRLAFQITLHKVLLYFASSCSSSSRFASVPRRRRAVAAKPWQRAWSREWWIGACTEESRGASDAPGPPHVVVDAVVAQGVLDQLFSETDQSAISSRIAPPVNAERKTGKPRRDRP